MTFFFPRWTIARARLYLGIVSLLFLVNGLRDAGRDRTVRMLAVMAVMGLLLAFGKYNPLYVAALKLSGFYGFRNPSKFIFFALTFASIIAGIGFTRFFDGSADGGRARSAVRRSVRSVCSK